MKKLFACLFLVVCFLFPNYNVTTAAAPNYNIQYLEKWRLYNHRNLYFRCYLAHSRFKIKKFLIT